MFTKGQIVEIRPTRFAMQVWQGEILRKTKNGYSVRYYAFGIRSKEVFSERELTAI